MVLAGGCCCGALRFEIGGEIRIRGLCLCRTCQKISGGAGNLFVEIEADDFRYVEGQPRRFRRANAADAPTREFCAACGVHVAARSPRARGGVIVKVGALDDPAAFEGLGFVVWTQDKFAFHPVPDGVPAFAQTPRIGAA